MGQGTQKEIGKRRRAKKGGNRRLAPRVESDDVVARKRNARRGVVRTMAVILVAGGLALGLPVAGWYGYRAVLTSGYFAPSDIEVSGNARVSAEAVIEAAGLDDDEANLIDLDTSDIEARVEAMSWVSEASVELKLPNQVRIEVVERETMGVVRDESLFVVDHDGEVIEAWDESYGVPDTVISGAGLVTADGGASRVRDGFGIVALYEAMDLDRFGTLSEVHHDRALGWTLFAGETEIRLGSDRLEARLQRLWQVQVLLEERGTKAEYVLLDLGEDIDRVAVRPVPRVVSAAEAAAIAAENAENEFDEETE